MTTAAPPPAQTATVEWGDNSSNNVNVPAVISAPTGPVSAPYSYQGHTYYAIKSSNLTHAQAEARAMQMGGHLVSINSLPENQFVVEMIRREYGSENGAWIGINDAAAEGSFAWTSGDPLFFTRWLAGQPVNTAGVDGAAINRAANGTTVSAGNWATFASTQLFSGAIIEMDGRYSFSSSHTYVDDEPSLTSADPYTIEVTVTAASSQSSAESTVNVSNVAPVVAAGPDLVIGDLVSTFTVSGSFIDPGVNDTWTATVNYGDGGGPQALTLNPDKTFSLNHNYLADGVYTVTVTISDDDSGVGTDTVVVTVNRYTVTTASDSGAGSLRQVITNANAHAGLDTIVFNISGTGVTTITPLSALPTITDAVVIDGYSQPGAHPASLTLGSAVVLIELSGATGGAVTDGLTIASAGSTIRGLAINRFSGSGININAIGASNNLIVGNIIGLAPDGTTIRANGSGIRITLGSNNQIGGDDLADGSADGVIAHRNIISGNTTGIHLSTSGSNLSTLVQGNYIGTNAAGTAARANSTGIAVGSAPGTIVGGATPGAGNLISGNSTGISISNISHPVINGQFNSLVQGNMIGLNAAGTAALGNGVGILVTNANNLIGGTTAAERNIISGNTSLGIRITGLEATGNIVSGNYIGTDPTGTIDRGNGGDGVRIEASASNNIIGGLTASPGTGAGNVISGNNERGVWLIDATANIIQGNIVGLDATGTVALANAFQGIEITRGSGNIIGGTASGARNIVSANGGGFGGILLAGASGTVVQGNYIGTDITGTLDRGNWLGIELIRASNNTIGGTTAAARNVISGNTVSGIHITADNPGGFFGSLPAVATGNLVLGNYIGTDKDGNAALGNSQHGVMIENAAGNTIGGVAAGEGNLIAFQSGAGVFVTGSASVGNTIRGNSMRLNGGLGIDLAPAGVTPNDAGDADVGPNNLLNFPENTIAVSDGHVLGTLHSAADSTFTIDFYASSSADPSGHGEGQRYLGSGIVLTGPDGNGSFDVAGLQFAIHEFITATATDAAGNTSEFSTAQRPNHRPEVTNVLASPSTVPEGGSVQVSGAFTDEDAFDTHTAVVNWGDGSSSPAVVNQLNRTFSAQHVYADDRPGAASDVFVITVTVADEQNLTDSLDGSVTVENLAPTAAISPAPALNFEGQAITLTASATDPAGALDTLSYAWTVSKDDVPGFAGGTGTNISFTPDDNGVYLVTLTVSDEDGGVGVAQQAIAVLNVEPTVTLSTPPAVSLIGTQISLSSTVSDPGAADTLTYTWTVDRTFNQGGLPVTEQVATATGTAATHSSFSYTPIASGSYALRLTVRDDDLGSGSAVRTVTVVPVVLVVSIDDSPEANSFVEGAAVELVGSATPIPPGGVTYTYHWSVTKNGAPFGPGLVSTTSAASSPFSFTPDDNGAYAVTLTINGSDESTGSTTVSYVVSNANPTATIQGAPTAAITEGTLIHLTSTVSDPGAADTLTYVWTVARTRIFAGQPITQQFATGTGPAFSFTPNDDGVSSNPWTYTATLVVADDDDGSFAVSTDPITVINVAPIASIVPVDNPDPTVISLAAEIIDPGADDTFAYSWNAYLIVTNTDGTVVEVPIASGAGQTFSFNRDPNVLQFFKVTLQVSDDDGGASGLQTTTIAGGTQGNDTITIDQNNQPPAGAEVIVFGLAGNDTINASQATVAVTLDGGAGDDTLIGGGGSDTLILHQGNDTADGGDGDNEFVLFPNSQLTVNAGTGANTLNFASASLGIAFNLDIQGVFQDVAVDPSQAGAHFVKIGRGNFTRMIGSSLSDRIFTSTASIVSGAGDDEIFVTTVVKAVTIMSGGSGYTSAPTVVFSDPPAGGTRATGFAIIDASGAVTGITITNGGAGYTSAPTVTFSDPPAGGTRATGTAILSRFSDLAIIDTGVGNDRVSILATGSGDTALDLDTGEGLDSIEILVEGGSTFTDLGEIDTGFGEDTLTIFVEGGSTLTGLGDIDTGADSDSVEIILEGGSTDTDFAETTLDTGEGDDSLTIEIGGSTSTDLGEINLGLGEDDLVIVLEGGSTFTDLGETDFFTGEGSDSVTIEIIGGSGDTALGEIDTGEGSDELTIIVEGGSTFTDLSETEFSTGDGDDSVSIEIIGGSAETTFGEIDTGEGNDDLTIIIEGGSTDTDFGESVFLTGDGDDSVTIFIEGGSTFTDFGEIDTGTGNDELTIIIEGGSSDTGLGETEIFTADGDDSVAIFVEGGSLDTALGTIDTGVGNDDLTIIIEGGSIGTDFDETAFLTGEGDDSVTILVEGGSTFTDLGEVDTGSGDDDLVIIVEGGSSDTGLGESEFSMGEGDDSVTILVDGGSSDTALGTIDTGLGADEVTIIIEGGSTDTGLSDTEISTAEGDDSLTIIVEGGSTETDLSGIEIVTGEGDDSVAIFVEGGSSDTSLGAIDTELGDDSVTLVVTGGSSDTSLEAPIETGEGDDAVLIVVNGSAHTSLDAFSDLGGVLTDVADIVTGAGNDRVRIFIQAGSTDTEIGEVFTGEGEDSLQIFITDSSETLLDLTDVNGDTTGDDNDSIRITITGSSDTTFEDVLDAGEGDDSLTIVVQGGSTLTDFEGLATDEGDDTLVILVTGGSTLTDISDVDMGEGDDALGIFIEGGSSDTTLEITTDSVGAEEGDDSVTIFVSGSTQTEMTLDSLGGDDSLAITVDGGSNDTTLDADLSTSDGDDSVLITVIGGSGDTLLDGIVETEAGADSLEIFVIGGSGETGLGELDVFTGEGDDSLAITMEGGSTDTLLGEIDTGDGNDAIVIIVMESTAGGTAVAAVSAGGDNDVFILSSRDAMASITAAGGIGGDTYYFTGPAQGHFTLVESAATSSRDRVDYSGFTGGPISLNLALSQEQQVASGLWITLPWDALSSLTGIEDVVGTSFGDSLTGNAAANVLQGADPIDDRYTTAPLGWNGRTQVVLLDFDSQTNLLVEHVYTTAQRTAIQARIEADYSAFHVFVTQDPLIAEAAGKYATLYFNMAPVDLIPGAALTGGQATQLDFRNTDLGGQAAIQLSGVIGRLGQPADTSENWIALSANIGAHELGHLMGLRHSDAFGPIGFGIHHPPGAAGFDPEYPGPVQALESFSRLISSPDTIGSNRFSETRDMFFGEREAVKLAFAESGFVITEIAADQKQLALSFEAQSLGELRALAVPNTLLTGINAGKTFAVAAIDVIGSISIAGQSDYYSFQGRAGDLINLEVMSRSLVSSRTLAGGAIDPVARVYYLPAGQTIPQLVPYYGGVAVSDDEFELRGFGADSMLIDLRLPANGVYVIEVDTFFDPDISFDTDTDTGDYELFLYRFDAGNAQDEFDVLRGGAGVDLLIGGSEEEAEYYTPAAQVFGDAAIDENTQFSGSGFFNDPGGSSWTATVNYGDGTGTQPLKLNSDKTFVLSHVYRDGGTYSVIVTITSDDGAAVVVGHPILVNNVGPSDLSLQLNTTSIDEGSVVELSGSFQAPVGSQDAYTVLIDWGDGSLLTLPVLAAGTLNFSGIVHQYADNPDFGTYYTITVTVTDDDDHSTLASANVTVSNVAPEIQSLTSNSPEEDHVRQGDPVSLTALFSDLGVLDTHSAMIDWGDGQVTPATITEAGGLGTAAGSHVYAYGGIYTVTMTLTDDDGHSAVQTTTVVIAGAGLHNGVLQIIGTSDLDLIFLYQWGGTLTVHSALGLGWGQSDDDWDDSDQVNQDWSCYGIFYRRLDVNAADVQSILIRAYGGHDYVFELFAINQPTTIEGGAGNDWMMTGGGDDVVTDLSGNNRIYSGSGTDIVTTGIGDDRIWTGAGNDTVNDAGGNNSINTDGGDDRITTGAGADVIEAGAGHDVVFAGAGNDTIGGGDGNDILIGGDGNDSVAGGNGRDILIGGKGADQIAGNYDEDIMIAGWTLFDANEAALQSILLEWTRTDISATVRASHLKGTTAGGLNLFYLKVDKETNGTDLRTVFDDAAVDTLMGTSGLDWLFYNFDGVATERDNITGNTSGDIKSDIDRQ